MTSVADSIRLTMCRRMRMEATWFILLGRCHTENGMYRNIAARKTDQARQVGVILGLQWCSQRGVDVFCDMLNRGRRCKYRVVHDSWLKYLMILLDANIVRKVISKPSLHHCNCSHYIHSNPKVSSCTTLISMYETVSFGILWTAQGSEKPRPLAIHIVVRDAPAPHCTGQRRSSLV